MSSQEEAVQLLQRPGSCVLSVPSSVLMAEERLVMRKEIGGREIWSYSSRGQRLRAVAAKESV